MFWIDTFTSPSTFLCYNFSFGSIPSPHQVHSIAFLQQHLVGEVKVLIQNFLFHRVLHVGEVKIKASVSLRTGGRSMFYKHLLLLLLNQRNTTQADYKVTFKDIYYFHCITHYQRQIFTDNIIIKLSSKVCGVILNNRESNSLLLANAATYYYYYYYYR